LNTFGYVGGNPINWIDPEGLKIGHFGNALRNFLKPISRAWSGLKRAWRNRGKKQKDDSSDDTPSSQKIPKDEPFKCSPEREANCQDAFWRCMRNDGVSEVLCITALATCLQSNTLPQIFPDGGVVK